jgi:hypothetical protein
METKFMEPKPDLEIFIFRTENLKMINWIGS